jgi:hypothetical protein
VALSSEIVQFTPAKFEFAQRGLHFRNVVNKFFLKKLDRHFKKVERTF